MELELNAAAKINIHLQILKRRSDGFHGLQSIVAALDFGDTLLFQWDGRRGGAVTLETVWECRCDDIIEPHDNLVIKAIRLFQEKTGFDYTLHVKLTKRIPLGAGLGGGSSDAACTLLALNRISALHLPIDALHVMTAALGSDVPFFLYGGLAFMSGRGEAIKRIAVSRQFWVVLVFPGFSSNTRESYRRLDEARHEYHDEATPDEAVLLAVLQKDPTAWAVSGVFKNDFLPVLLSSPRLEEARMYRRILEGLKKSGAAFYSITGSGSSCFGIFTNSAAAEQAAAELAQKFHFVHLSFFSCAF
ncbi:4-(cytidine 5'-diphospho)-2-C-methyl-D-erythritol kinase [Breznakiellaceae bacterium SP9]